MSGLDQLHHDYGAAYLEFQARHDPARPLPNLSGEYIIFSLGVGGSHLASAMLFKKSELSFYLLLQGEHRDAMFCHLYADKGDIDAALPPAPEWTVSKTSNRARVTIALTGIDFEDRQDWPRQHGWILQAAQDFDHAFRHRLHALKGTP